ncbi:MAG: hypothetical protein H0V44_04880 [Planctomycetes bacterium]|nr:hypothetical protein [Planctomycetota bacterium]
MTTYEHFQAVKKDVKLPKKDSVGACLTCKFWKAEEKRGERLVPRLALCVQPHLKGFALIVSGSSGCNAWVEKPNIEPSAKAYAKRGEED